MYAPTYYRDELNRRRRPFWRGVASVLNISPRQRTRKVTDKESLQSDWEAVGRDFHTALHTLRQGKADT